MLKLGMPVNRWGSPALKEHFVHVNELWEEFGVFASGKGKAHYGAALGSSNPFDDWHIGQRYASRANFDTARINRHRAGCVRVRNLLSLARADGVL